VLASLVQDLVQVLGLLVQALAQWAVALVKQGSSWGGLLQGISACHARTEAARRFPSLTNLRRSLMYSDNVVSCL
jgi:fatty acid-binding protein DegV